MPFTTSEQFLVLALLLIGGWLIGYASAPSTKRLRRRVKEQSTSFTAYHDAAEERLRAANQRVADLSAEADALRADNAEAERTIAALRADTPLANNAVPHETVAHHPRPIDAPAEPAMPTPEVPTKAWHTSIVRDDLTRISGIDSALNTRLFGLGVLRFDDLEKLSDQDEMALEQRLALPAGYILREQWRSQAASLCAAREAMTDV